MHVSLRKPTPAFIERFLAEQRALDFSYAEVGATRGEFPPGYDADRVRVEIGRGGESFARAASALRAWAQFRTGWTEVHPAGAPVEPGSVVAVLARAAGVWTMHACRVIYRLEDAAPVERFGFGYGTLPGHGEYGEERFVVERLADGSVWYEVAAFFRPADWRLRLLWPVLRRTMDRFRRESAEALRQATSSDGAP